MGVLPKKSFPVGPVGLPPRSNILAPEPDFDKRIVTPQFEFQDRTAGGRLAASMT
jgi:hypothetical protein